MTLGNASTPNATIGPIQFDASELVPVVAQDEATGDVLLLAYMNEEALRRTLAEGVLVLWSRSRGRIWRKGEQSGHTLRTSELRVNCEGNSLLARVRLEGPGACHEGYRTCYFRRVATSANRTFEAQIVEEQTFDPEAVYGTSNVPQTPTEEEAQQVISREDAFTIPEEFEQLTRELYAAYERLRDEDHTATSSTSRLLHEPDREAAAQHAAARAMEELGELRGVIAGTHRHSGGDDDVILEAGQVEYWAIVAVIALGQDYDAWRPHALWLAGWSGAHRELPPHDSGLLLNCAETILAAGELCRAAGVHPTMVVTSDLATVQAKHPNSSMESTTWKKAGSGANRQ
jgi:phosphoribosyl-AMP cyclohydrolase